MKKALQEKLANLPKNFPKDLEELLSKVVNRKKISFKDFLAVNDKRKNGLGIKNILIVLDFVLHVNNEELFHNLLKILPHVSSLINIRIHSKKMFPVAFEDSKKYDKWRGNKKDKSAREKVLNPYRVQAYDRKVTMFKPFFENIIKRGLEKNQYYCVLSFISRLECIGFDLKFLAEMRDNTEVKIKKIITNLYQVILDEDSTHILYESFSHIPVEYQAIARNIISNYKQASNCRKMLNYEANLFDIDKKIEGLNRSVKNLNL